MQQQQPQQLLPARAAIEYTCRLLQSYGIDQLTPELIRQAKFDAPAACRPLLQALHDLAVCLAAGLAAGCKEGMCALQQQLQQESVDGDTLPAEGVVLLLHLLAQWGCPPGLLAQLACVPRDLAASSSNSSSCSSRACLLCLAWLIGHGQLFDRALQHLQLSPGLLKVLPPYPEDTSTTAASQAKYAAAASAAQQHARKVQQLISAPPSSSSGGGNTPAGSGCWPQVQAAAHHLLSTYRAASMKLQLLSSLLEGREKLLHQIQQAQLDANQHLRQQQQRQQRSSPTRHPNSNCSSRQLGPAALTAFELHLLSSPQLLQQHQQALQRACSLLQQQLQCVQAAQTFFAWASSVLEEEQGSLSASLGACDVASSATAGVSGSKQMLHRSAAACQLQARHWLLRCCCV
ncbi:hypothetical protein COO60DRAFT_513932 [Scenedesmus sp. NREL 46B-D3]|nr:hypothetical protein COO60DRAFT_513932 [Scenedesmus sp. NREL 46B-D3]